jgi:SAM-dependent MidA family methyltransferase
LDYGGTVTEIEKHLKARIRDNGPIPFDQFMEAALYHPVCGYYEKAGDDPVGSRGDFITSVSVGRTFGRLLALQLIDYRKSLPNGEEVSIMEAGAHNGQLALDILEALSELGHLGDFSEYVIIEPSPTRRIRQSSMLSEFNTVIRWTEGIHDLPQSSRAIFISNELFDAMPVRCLYWDSAGQCWGEWLVGLDSRDGDFQWVRDSSGTPAEQMPSVIRDRLALAPGIREVIPEGFSIEVSPAAVSYMDRVAGKLCEGYIVTVDYGAFADHWLRPQQLKGSLRGFHSHRRVDNILSHPGEVDITADVCFDDLVRVGSSIHWQQEFADTQQRYLTGILQSHVGFLEESGDFWTAADRRRFMTLVSSQFFGERFKVLVQRRGS